MFASSPTRHEDIVLRATIGSRIVSSLIEAGIAELPECGSTRQPLAWSTAATGVKLAARRANKPRSHVEPRNVPPGDHA